MRTRRYPASANRAISWGPGSMKWMLTPNPAGTTGGGRPLSPPGHGPGATALTNKRAAESRRFIAGVLLDGNEWLGGIASAGSDRLTGFRARESSDRSLISRLLIAAQRRLSFS